MVAFFRLSSLVFRLIMKWILAVFGRAGSPFIADEVEKYVKRLRGSAMPPRNEYRRVILSEEGKLMTTVKLADTLQARFTGNIVFLIGSAYGIDENLKKSADLLLSLSPLTFTHDHARIITVEQLYRVQMVMQNHPYHHR